MKRNSRLLSCFFALLLAISLVPRGVMGEEGMFLPDALGSLPMEKLNKLGLKLPVSEIYNPTGASLTDAVVIVGGGSGAFVSPEGLLLTNHHVAFDALVDSSQPGNDLGTLGFVAKSRSDELPAPKYTVTITQGVKNVTNDILSRVPDSSAYPERLAAMQNKIRTLESTQSKEADGVRVRVVPLNEGLAYYQFTYLILRDVRIVYAPPKNIGFFGGDPDNFEWPRHCGDFTFMRAYVGPDGKPADYSASNVPYKPKKFLSISMDGVKDGDFTMILGYPGSTRRYRESHSIAYNQDISMPFYVDVFTRQIEVLEGVGRNNPEQRIKLQGTIFDLANVLKNYEGSILALRRAEIVSKRQAEEAAFTRWVEADPARKAKYGEALPMLAKAYNELLKTAAKDLLLQQIYSASDLLGIAILAQQAAAEKEKPEAERNPNLAVLLESAKGQIPEALGSRNPTVEREVLSFLIRKADELPAGQKIEFLEKRFLNLQGDARIQAQEKFASSISQSKRFSNVKDVQQLLDLSTAQLRELNEPVFSFAADLNLEIEKIQARTQNFNMLVARWRPFLIQGMSEMRGVTPYPDANRTLRFTYGQIRGYIPREAISYSPFTTLTGVLEKDTGREPFDVPEKLKQLYRARDFGPYALPGRAEIPVNFLSTNDIIGGNSGSPILNGRGEQVGIVFDGNYEGLGNDFFYNETKGRTISVDIRYVLFITDKFGSAGWILKELDIKKTQTAVRAQAVEKLEQAESGSP